jgi:hypothetical protein
VTGPGPGRHDTSWSFTIGNPMSPAIIRTSHLRRIHSFGKRGTWER